MRTKGILPAPNKIMIVGDFPSSEDIRTGKAFSGPSGTELSRLLTEANIDPGRCFYTHAIDERPSRGDLDNFIAPTIKARTPEHANFRGKYVLPVIVRGAKDLAELVDLCQPNAIVAMGELALWMLTGQDSIMSWRCSELPSILPTKLSRVFKVIPTFSVGQVLSQWSWRSILLHDLRKVSREASSPELFKTPYNFQIRPHFAQASTTLRMLEDKVTRGPFKLSVDIETRSGHIACIGLAWSDLEAICIPFMCVESPSGYWTEAQEAYIWYALKKVLYHTNCEVIGQNFSYDIQYFYRWMCFMPRLARDTMIAQHSMFSNIKKDLGFLSSMYLPHHVYWKDEGKLWNADASKGLGEEDVWWTYNCKDAAVTYAVDTAQQGAVDKMGLREVHDFQQKLFWPVVETMNRGIEINMGLRGQFALELSDAIMERQNTLEYVLGHTVNPKSPLQLQTLFYGDLAQKRVINPKTGKVSCDEASLTKVADREPALKPLVATILELRSLGVFLSTFVNAPLDIDGRMRCSFNIAGTETYRFSSRENAFGSGMNLQNIPKGGEGSVNLPNVRKLFIPGSGRTFFDIDLSSADLRIVVWDSDEPEMKAIFREDLDPYTEVAREFYKDPKITKKDPRRQNFKKFCHSTNYLGTPEGIAGQLGWTVHETETMQRWYFRRFPMIKKWQDDFKFRITSTKKISNIFGYQLHIFDRIEGNVMNEAIAWLPQSTVSCIINRAYVNIYETLKEVEILLQCHDSLAGTFPDYLGDWAVREIIKRSEIMLPYDDPMFIPVGVVTSKVSWGDCK